MEGAYFLGVLGQDWSFCALLVVVGSFVYEEY